MAEREDKEVKQEHVCDEEVDHGDEELPKKKIRLRFVDFMRIENYRNFGSLSSFERKVRLKMITGVTVRDQLVQQEEEQAAKKSTQLSRLKLSFLLEKARLNPMLKSVYQGLYVDNLSTRDLSKKLGVTSELIKCKNRQLILRLRDVLDRHANWLRMPQRVWSKSGKMERLVLKKYFQEFQSAGEIQTRTGLEMKRIYNILESTLKNFPDKKQGKTVLPPHFGPIEEGR